MKCIYCSGEILKKSKEHIIHNALGGTLESTDICCDVCNKFLSKQDAKFTKIFNPILMHLPSFRKSNNKNSAIKIQGKIKYNEKEYNAIIPNRKILASPDLNKEFKQNIQDFSFIDAYNFELFKITDNKIFLDGFRKIAFNYAVDSLRKKNIPLEKLKENIFIAKIKDSNKLEKIEFNQTVVPFYSVTCFEKIIDMKDNDVFHNLILFTDNGSNLWCYVGLFNTFKYYVLLAANCNFSINESYCQKISEINHETDFVYMCSYKDKIILSQEFSVDIGLEDETFIKTIKEIIRKKDNKMDYYQYIDNIASDIGWAKVHQELISYYLRDYRYYTKNTSEAFGDEERYVDENKFKKTILIGNKEISYPIFILISFNKQQFRKFCDLQLIKLKSYICNEGKIS